MIETDFALREDFISFTRLLLLPDDDWEKARGKCRPPKPKLDAEVLGIIAETLQRRKASYPTTLEVFSHLLP